MTETFTRMPNSPVLDMSNTMAFLHSRAGRREEAAMKAIPLRFLVLLVIGLLFSELAWAHGGYRGYGYPRNGYWHGHPHASVGIVLGVPLVGAWTYRQPGIYTYPPVVTVPAVPQAYMEKNAREQQANSWWYYCRSAQAYYPYVRECPNGWELVSPQPSDLR